MAESYRPCKKQSGPVSVSLSKQKLSVFCSNPILVQQPNLTLTQISSPTSPTLQPYCDQSSTHASNLYGEKGKVYKSTISDIASENESLKVKLKNALIRISALYGKLKMFLSQAEINSDCIRFVADEKEKDLKETMYNLKAKSQQAVVRHQKPVRDLLIQYGCSEEEASIHTFADQGQVVRFLVKKFNEKGEVLRKYEAETQQKLDRNKEQILKLQKVIKQLTQANEQLRAKQSRHRKRVQQVRYDWVQLSENLSRKQLDCKHWQAQNYQLRRRTEQLEKELSQYQAGSNKQDCEQLRAQLSELAAKATEYEIKYQEACTILEQTQLAIEEAEMRERFRQSELERLSREVVRWRERYELLERVRSGSREDAFRSDKLDHNYHTADAIVETEKELPRPKTIEKSNDTLASPTSFSSKQYEDCRNKPQKSVNKRGLKPSQNAPQLKDIIRNFQSSLSRVKQKYSEAD